MARECAQVAHAALLQDGVLAEGDCLDPSDLSAVADAVWTKTGQQRPLVEHLPLSEFRHSEPNEGYLAAAALLRERALAAVVTLNYDLTISHGLAAVTSSAPVEELAGLADHYRLSTANVIYLHRNVNSGPEEWVMRTAVLAQGWRGGWEEMIASAVLVTPVTVFVGLGSRATVLIETVIRIRQALQSGIETFQVDTDVFGGSAFTAVAGINEDRYVRMGWSAFMADLGQRVVNEHLATVVTAAQQFSERENIRLEQIANDCDLLRHSGLVGLGRMRARWFLDRFNYVRCRDTRPEWTADVLLGIALVERVLGAEARFSESGLVEFDRHGVVIASVLVGHGMGDYRWASLETRMRLEVARRFTGDQAPNWILLLGHVGPPSMTSLPESLVGEADVNDVVRGPSTIRFLSVDELRADENAAQKLAS